MKLKRFLLRYYPPGIILEYQKGDDVRERSPNGRLPRTAGRGAQTPRIEPWRTPRTPRRHACA